LRGDEVADSAAFCKLLFLEQTIEETSAERWEPDHPWFISEDTIGNVDEEGVQGMIIGI